MKVTIKVHKGVLQNNEGKNILKQYLTWKALFNNSGSSSLKTQFTINLKTCSIFQTIRCTFPPKFGRKMGVRLIVRMYLTFTLVKYYVIYVIKHFTTFFASEFFSYFPPLKPRCVLWSEKYGICITI